MNLLKILKRVLVLLLLLVVGALLSVTIFCHYYQDQITQKFVAEAQRSLQTPVEVRSVRLTLFKTFPRITIVLQDVAIKDDTTTWIAAGSISCAFDLWQVLRGRYVLDRLTFAQGQIAPAALLGGVSMALKMETTDPPPPTSPLDLDLTKLVLEDMDIVYSSQHEHYALHAQYLQMGLKYAAAKLQANLWGKATIQHIQHPTVAWTPRLPLKLEATLIYDPKLQKVTLQPIKIQKDNAQIALRGSWSLQEDASGTLQIQGQQITAKALRAHLPKQYQSAAWNGQLAFDLNVQKPAGKKPPMALNGTFAFQEVTYRTPHLNDPLQLKEAKGALKIPDLQNLQTAQLEVHDMVGTLAQSHLKGSLTLHNFDRPRLQCATQGTIDLAMLNPMLAQAPVQDVAGQLMLDCQLRANLRPLMMKLATPKDVCLNGTVQLQNLEAQGQNPKLQWKDVSAHLVLQDENLSIKKFTGNLGTSQFAMSGTLQQVSQAYWKKDPSQLSIQGKFYMDHVDTDAFKGEESQTTNSASSLLGLFFCKALDIDCDIRQIRHHHFQAKAMRGRVRLRGKKLSAEKVQFATAAGKVSLDSALTAHKKGLHVHTTATIQDADLRKVFYTFKNFRQTFLMDKHLSGLVSAGCRVDMQTDFQGNIDWDTIDADINTDVRSGVLLDFPPLQQLGAYVPQKSLREIHFPVLETNLKIQKGVIHIPPTDIHTNIAPMQFSGTHTLAGKINYNLVVPLKDLGGGGIMAELLSGANARLKIQGKIEDYQVTCELEEVQQKLKDTIQETVDEHKEEIKEGLKKYQDPETLKKLAEDYFGF